MRGRPKILAGFDGFVDTIARPALKSGNPPEYFRTIKEFGTYIAEHAGKSASIEMEILDRRMGGNMPHFAGAAAALGAELRVLGMLSCGERIDPVFQKLPGRALSFASAGTAAALEFEDGKIFLAPRYTLEGSAWALIKTALETAGLELAALLEEAELIACLNWSELDFMDELWRRLYEACAVLLKPDKKRYVFFDLCDCGRKSSDEIRGVLSLISRFTALRTTILSLNRNEALLLDSLNGLSGSPEEIAGRLAESCNIDEIVIHSRDGALARTGEGITAVKNEIAAKPKISTGAGDHFNAAYAFASLEKLSAKERLDFAVRCARFYVSSGKTPCLADLGLT